MAPLHMTGLAIVHLVHLVMWKLSMGQLAMLAWPQAYLVITTWAMEYPAMGDSPMSMWRAPLAPLLMNNLAQPKFSQKSAPWVCKIKSLNSTP